MLPPIVSHENKGKMQYPQSYHMNLGDTHEIFHWRHFVEWQSCTLDSVLGSRPKETIRLDVVFFIKNQQRLWNQKKMLCNIVTERYLKFVVLWFVHFQLLVFHHVSSEDFSCGSYKPTTLLLQVIIVSIPFRLRFSVAKGTTKLQLYTHGFLALETQAK